MFSPTTYSITDCVLSVLDVFSNNYPNKLVNPDLISCFVVKSRNKKVYYYPVISIKAITNMYGEHAEMEVNINPYLFCRNPIGIKTKITGTDFIHLDKEIKDKNYIIDNWSCRCPQLDYDGHIYIEYSDPDPEIMDIIAEGILLIR